MVRSHCKMIFALAFGLTACSYSYAQHQDGEAEFTMALTGDSIITRKLSVYEEPEFLELIDRLQTNGTDLTSD